MRALNFKEKYDILGFAVKIAPFVMVSACTALFSWVNFTFSRNQAEGRRLKSSKSLFMGASIGLVSVVIASASGSKIFFGKDQSFLGKTINYLFRNQENRVELIAQYGLRAMIFGPFACASFYYSRFNNRLASFAESLFVASSITCAQEFICRKALAALGECLKNTIEKRAAKATFKGIDKVSEYVKSFRPLQAINGLFSSRKNNTNNSLTL